MTKERQSRMTKSRAERTWQISREPRNWDVRAIFPDVFRIFSGSIPGISRIHSACFPGDGACVPGWFGAELRKIPVIDGGRRGMTLAAGPCRSEFGSAGIETEIAEGTERGLYLQPSSALLPCAPDPQEKAGHLLHGCGSPSHLCNAVDGTHRRYPLAIPLPRAGCQDFAGHA